MVRTISVRRTVLPLDASGVSGVRVSSTEQPETVCAVRPLPQYASPHLRTERYRSKTKSLTCPCGMVRVEVAVCLLLVLVLDVLVVLLLLRRL